MDVLFLVLGVQLLMTVIGIFFVIRLNNQRNELFEAWRRQGFNDKFKGRGPENRPSSDAPLAEKAYLKGWEMMK